MENSNKETTSAWIRREASRQQLEIETKPIRKNIEYYLGEPDPVDKYSQFNQWCKDQGMLAPKLEYPAYFENGLVGVRCTEDVHHREAYLFVPYKMMMNVKKANRHPVIGEIIAAHPECFSEEENTNAGEQMTLTLFILYEMTLGKQSFWYPYLRTMPDVSFTSSWQEHEIEMAQDEYLVIALQEYEAEVEAEWDTFQGILKEYP